MKKINFIISLRALIRQRRTSLINLSGLSVGFAGVFMLVLFVISELEHGNCPASDGNLYRINTTSERFKSTYSLTPYVLGTTMLTDKPEGLELARVMNFYRAAVKVGDDYINEDNIYCSENDIFSLFDIKILAGDPENMLSDPNSLVLTRSNAIRYFGTELPLGEEMIIMNSGEELGFVVKGVIEDFPKNSLFSPGMLIPVDISLRMSDKMIMSGDSEARGKEYYENAWDFFVLYTTYVSIPGDMTKISLGEMINSYQGKHFNNEYGLSFDLQPYSDIYFRSGNIEGGESKGDINLVIIYAGVAALLLLTTVLNYILLSVSMIEKRKKGIAVRLMMGSRKNNVILDAIVESFLFSSIAAILGITLFELLLPVLSETLFGKSLSVNYFDDWRFTISLILIIIIAACLSGLYIGLRIMRRSALDLLNETCSAPGPRLGLSRVLTMVQLAVTLSLLVSSGVVYSQIDYFRNADTGFDIANILSIDVGRDDIRNNYEYLKNEISKHPSVIAVSGSMWTPPTNNNMVFTLNRVDNPDESVVLQGLMVDYNFATAMGLELTGGEDLSFKDVKAGGVLINEKAVSALGIEGPPVGLYTHFGIVKGVVKDFNLHSFHQEVQPVMLQLAPSAVRTLLVRVDPLNRQAAIDHINKVWTSLDTEDSPQYSLLSDVLDNLYGQEKRFVKLLSIFTTLTLFISLLGILAMVMLSAEKRTKDIGVRKVMGAGAGSVLKRYIGEYFIMTFLSAIVAYPLTYIFMKRWIEEFAYHRSISSGLFVLSLVLILAVVLSTVFAEIYKSIRANPVDALRYE